MNWGLIVIELSKFITAVGIIIGAIKVVLNKLLKDIYESDRMQLRFTIVSFASDLHKGIPHTRDEYLSVFELIDRYNWLCKTLGVPNHVFEAECKYIDNCFQELDILKLGKE